MKLRHLDLFSGIGGFALAARMVGGYETVGFCEIEPYCQAVLRKHWPGVPIYDDVRSVRGVGCDVITGGFPCQPYSQAGKRLGREDDRHLWPEYRRVIQESRPAWVIGENVPGIVSMELDNVLADLERLGYACTAFAVPACAVGAPHVRERIWIVAHREANAPHPDPDGLGSHREALHEHGDAQLRHEQISIARSVGEDVSDADSRGREIERQSQHGEQQSARGDQPDGLRERGWRPRADVADAVRGGREGRSQRRPVRARQPGGSAAGQTDDAILDAGRELLEGRQPWQSNQPAGQWAIEPDVGRVAHGIPARVDRLRSLGNAIVPQVAAIFLEAIRMSHDKVVSPYQSESHG